MALCLDFLNWDPRIQCKGIRPSKIPCVACLSHTAGTYEFLLYWLFFQCNPCLKHSCLVMAGKDNPLFDTQPYKWVLSRINIILLGDKRWEESQNYVNHIVDQVKINKYKMLIIAPTGKNEKRPWKSGYYYIGKKLGWGYRVVGFDFEIKRLKMGPLVPNGKSLNITQQILKKHMGDIVPLRVKNSLVPIRSHKQSNVNFVNKTSVLIPISLLIVSLFLVFFLRKYTGATTIWSTIFHVVVSLYGLYLQSNNDIVINCIGLSIIYQHIFVIYLGFPSVPENVIIAGALLGFLTGVNNNERSVYIPLLYSLLSKIPYYAKSIQDQCRVIVSVVILAVVFQRFHQ